MLASFKATLDAAKVALNTAILVNGGATAALLAWSASVYAKNQTFPPVGNALACFGGGVFCAAVASGVAFLTQSQYQHYTEKQINGEAIGQRPWQGRILAIVLIGGAYLLFIAGAELTFNALTGGMAIASAALGVAPGSSALVDVVYVEHSPFEFGWDALVAIGTILLAIATFVAVVIPLSIEKTRRNERAEEWRKQA